MTSRSPLRGSEIDRPAVPERARPLARMHRGTAGPKSRARCESACGTCSGVYNAGQIPVAANADGGLEAMRVVPVELRFRFMNPVRRANASRRTACAIHGYRLVAPAK